MSVTSAPRRTPPSSLRYDWPRSANLKQELERVSVLPPERKVRSVYVDLNATSNEDRLYRRIFEMRDLDLRPAEYAALFEGLCGPPSCCRIPSPTGSGAFGRNGWRGFGDDETPVPLRSGGRAILHVVPFPPFAGRRDISAGPSLCPKIAFALKRYVDALKIYDVGLAIVGLNLWWQRNVE